MNDITPIFVLGLQRSGTTWLANTLSGHPDIAAVEAPDHQGVHESIFFSHFAREYGDLSDAVSFDRFAEDFTASDYFLLSGVSESWFREARPSSYPQAFELVMDEVARREGARFWVEKSPHHTLLSRELAEAFPRARFVCVVRDPPSLIRSRLWAFGRVPPPYPGRVAATLRACAAVALYQRHLDRFASSCDRAVLITHEEMAADLEGAMRKVTESVGCGFHPAMMESRFRANTSFASRSQKERALGAGDRPAIKAFMAFFNALPLDLLRAMERRRSRRRGIEWPAWCWKRRPRPSGSKGARAAHLASST